MATLPLAAEEVGEGAPWVFLHGFPLGRAMWDRQRVLARRARLLLPDLRGFGESPAGPPGAPATMDAMADDVLALLDERGVERAGVAGFSLGGYVALALQRRAPGRVGALALLDTQAGADSSEARDGRETLARKVEAEGVEPLVAAFVPKFFTERGQHDRALVAEAERLIRFNRPAPMAAALRGMGLREDHRGRLRDVACPTLVLVGEADVVTPPPVARALVEALPDARLAVIPAAAHLAPWENAAAVNEALDSFFEQADPHLRPEQALRTE